MLDHCIQCRRQTVMWLAFSEEYRVSDINSDLIAQEVDDEVRRERMNQLWSAYGKYLIGLAVGIVLLVGGREGYTSYVQSQEEASSTAFEAAVIASSEDSANAVEIWKKALPELNGGYATLGQMRLAAAASANGDVAGAIASYDAIAADSSADPSLRSMAQLFAGMLVSREGSDLDAARARLSVVAIKGEPWYFSALEQLALVDIKKGDKEAALAGFSQLVSDAETPAGIRTRATQLKSAIEKELGIDPLAGLGLDAGSAASAKDTVADPDAGVGAPDTSEPDDEGSNQ